MSHVTPDYVRELPPIYRDILAAFPELEPARKAGFGLAYQTIYEAVKERYSLGEVIDACQEMQKAGAVKVEHGMFVHPTSFGEEIISGLTGHRAHERTVPPFPTP